MTEAQIGQLLAFLTALCWVIGANFFEIAGKRIGSLVVNLLRLWLAVLLLGLICWLARGSFWPIGMPRHVYVWMLISGVIGFFLCDMCLFRAFVLAGARRGMLMLSLAPCFAAILDLLTGHPPTPQILVGMIVTLAGVFVVITRRSREEQTPRTRHELRQGALLGITAALLQALGATTAEIGLHPPDGTRYDALAATFIRALAGASCFLILLLLTRRMRTVATGIRDAKAVAALSMGAIFGPVVGVTLFLASLARVQPSVTQTILATMPVLMLPIARFIRKERITSGALAGTVVAVIGVMILCWK